MENFGPKGYDIWATIQYYCKENSKYNLDDWYVPGVAEWDSFGTWLEKNFKNCKSYKELGFGSDVYWSSTPNHVGSYSSDSAKRIILLFGSTAPTCYTIDDNWIANRGPLRLGADF